MAYHDEKIEAPCIEEGVSETIYRYMRCCRHCASFEATGKNGRGRCEWLSKPTSAGVTTCDEFHADEETLTRLWLETEVREGRMCKITYKGRTHYLKKTELVAALGYDPDQ